MVDDSNQMWQLKLNLKNVFLHHTSHISNAQAICMHVQDLIPALLGHREADI